MFSEKEKIALISDVKVIKDNVMNMKPQVRANTRFRWTVLGFCGMVPIVLSILALSFMKG